MEAANGGLHLQLPKVAMVRLRYVAAFGLTIMVVTFAIAEIARPPIVLVGKIEHTFVPVEFPPAIWR